MFPHKRSTFRLMQSPAPRDFSAADGAAAASTRFNGQRNGHAQPENPGERLLTARQWRDVSRFLQLTPRELQVARLLFLGHTREVIAAHLQVTSRTVRQYIERLHVKLKVQDRVGLVLRIVEVRDELSA